MRDLLLRGGDGRGREGREGKGRKGRNGNEKGKERERKEREGKRERAAKKTLVIYGRATGRSVHTARNQF